MSEIYYEIKTDHAVRFGPVHLLAMSSTFTLSSMNEALSALKYKPACCAMHLDKVIVFVVILLYEATRDNRVWKG